MGKIEFEDDKRALVHMGDVKKPIATLYRLQDGWHAKLAHLHTRHAWSGPFDSPEDALRQLS